MPHIFKRTLSIIIVSFTLAFCLNAYAEQEQKSKYFNIYLHDGIDVVSLLNKLNANYFLGLKAAFSTGQGDRGGDTGELLGRALDALYLQTSDILDIHMYSFNIDLEIVPDKGALSQILQPFFNKSVNIPSFYFYDKNRIYISAQDLNAGMLSHEIAHAITSHYFVVPPPQIHPVSNK